VVPLFTEEMVIAVQREHPLATRETVAFTELRDEAWVLSPQNYELREATLSACQVAGFAPRVVLDGGETDTLLRFVAAGIGIALVPRLAVPHTSDLVALKVTDQHLTRSLGLVWRGDRVASPAARALREFLVERLRRE
jgi:DNA-binding transcriptional LysR family regulator